jgi:flagellar FliL protein
MNDNVDDQDMSFAEGEPEQAAAPKAKGAGPGLLKILTIVGIALGAVILIVTVVIVTMGVINKQGKPVANVTDSESFQAASPIYAYVTTIGEIRTRTIDAEPASVVVKINLGFDSADKEGPTEITQRLYQIRDYLRGYFSNKKAEELAPQNEAALKMELKEGLNNLLKKNGAIKEVLFETLNVVAM